MQEIYYLGHKKDSMILNQEMAILPIYNSWLKTLNSWKEKNQQQ